MKRNRLVLIAALTAALAAIFWLPTRDMDHARRTSGASSVLVADEPTSAPAGAPVGQGADGSAPAGAEHGAQGLAGTDADCHTALRAVATTYFDEPESRLTYPKLEAQLQSARARLIASRDPEHVYAAALLGFDPTQRASQMVEVAASPTRNPQLAWLALLACSSSEESRSMCQLERLEEQLLAVDRQNSEAWMLVATNRYRRGDRDEALRALRQAGAVGETNGYWAETIGLIERALAASGSYPFSQRSVFAISQAPLPRYSDLVNMCREQSAQSDDWARACLAYGQVTERRGDTMMSHSIGLAIQAAAHSALGQIERQRAAEARRDEARRERSDTSDSLAQLVETLRVLDPSYFAAYLEGVRQHGEVAAFRIARGQRPDLVRELGLSACAAEFAR